MKRAGLTGDVWPDDIQEQLLQAALLPYERGAAAWLAVRPRIDVNRLPGELHRLMPLLSRSLAAAGHADPDLARLKGVYQFSWYRNTMLFTDAAELLRRLQGTAVPTLLLRGAAIALAHRRDAGTRPMNDADILVPASDLDRARWVANAAGWRPLQPAHPLDRRLAAIPMRSKGGRVIRLHWQPSPNLPAESWGGLWERAINWDLSGVGTRLLSPADHLVHACVDGVRANSGASLRWVADSMALLNTQSGRLDWDVVVSESRRLRVTMLVSEALQYLQQALDATVPAAVSSALPSAPTTLRDRVAHRLSLTTTPRLPSTAEVAGRFLRLTAASPVREAAGAAPAFLANVLDVASPREVPRVALRKILRAAVRPTPSLASLSKSGASGIGAGNAPRKEFDGSGRSAR